MMSSKAVSSLALLLIIFMTLVSVQNTESADAEAAEITIQGFVGIPGDSEIQPEGGVGVYIMGDNNKGSIATATTGTDGIFRITAKVSDTSNIPMMFTKNGLGVLTVPECMKIGSDGIEILNLEGIDPVDGVYIISSSSTASQGHCILMTDAKVTITISVTGTTEALSGAEVVLLNQENEKQFVGKTDSKGICTISTNVPVGDYILKVSHDGCDEYQKTITITKTGTQFSIQLQEKGIPEYGGMTIYHILMVAGVGIGLLLVVIAYILCRRTWKGIDSNDSEN